MELQIREHVISLFEGAPRTKRSVELMEEMIQNLTENYNDLLGEGKTPEAAFNIIINGIGDVGELLNDLEDTPMKDDREFQKARQKSAIITSIAVMMYICSFIPAIIISEFADGSWSSIGPIFMFLTIAAATGLLIYNNMTKPRYLKSDDSMVEEFREFRSVKSGQKEVRKAISSAMWSIILVVYFLLSFWTGAWHITWLIFVIGGAVQNILKLIFTRYE